MAAEGVAFVTGAHVGKNLSMSGMPLDPPAAEATPTMVLRMSGHHVACTLA